MYEEHPIIQEIRDGMDELFIASENTLSSKSRELFEALGIDGFADIYVRSKRHGFQCSYKILADLVKLSFVVYTNLDKLPIQRKVILPEENGSYKFIVASLPHTFLRGNGKEEFKDIDTNVLMLVSTGESMHAHIAESVGLKSQYHSEVNILGGAWVDINHQKKTLDIKDDSGSYGSCSNQMVQWMLEEYEQQGYQITVNMRNQKKFFDEEK